MLQNTEAKKYSYATHRQADFKGKILECQFSGMLLKIQMQEVWTSLIGAFNAQNVLSMQPFRVLGRNVPTCRYLTVLAKEYDS